MQNFHSSLAIHHANFHAFTLVINPLLSDIPSIRITKISSDFVDATPFVHFSSPSHSDILEFIRRYFDTPLSDAFQIGQYRKWISKSC